MKKQAIQKYDPKPLMSLCEPLLRSYAVKRLDRISFLGILSPKYLKQFQNIISIQGSIINEGSRRDHSIGVALISFKITSKLNFSPETIKYAVCWGLLHDIGTWPLSHTGEAAFSDLFNLSSGKLREQMILGSNFLPQEYQVVNELREIGIDPYKLLSLFKGTRLENDPELNFFSTIIHSPITPDTLEGMWRTGKTWNVNVPQMMKEESKLQVNLFGPYIPKEHSKMYVNFWKKKSFLYEKFINNDICVAFESSWSLTIKEYFKNVSLVESLELKENEIVRRVKEKGLLNTNQIKKYKTPQVYSVNEDKGKFGDINLQYLNEYFIKKDKHGTSPIPTIPA